VAAVGSVAGYALVRPRDFVAGDTTRPFKAKHPDVLNRIKPPIVRGACELELDHPIGVRIRPAASKPPSLGCSEGRRPANLAPSGERGIRISQMAHPQGVRPCLVQAAK